jgi:hypothetical protein
MFLSVSGPALFISGVISQILNRGYFIAQVDGLSMTLFALQYFQKPALKVKPVFWGLLYLGVFGLGAIEEALYALCCILASQVSLYGYKVHIKKNDDLINNQRLVMFYEQRLKNLLKQHADLEMKLESFLSEETFFCYKQADGLEPLFQEDYSVFLDLIEKQTQIEQNLQLHKDKKPLKRLRRIMMKQTSFLDESNQS